MMDTIGVSAISIYESVGQKTEVLRDLGLEEEATPNGMLACESINCMRMKWRAKKFCANLKGKHVCKINPPFASFIRLPW